MELTYMDVQILQIWKKFAKSKSKPFALSAMPPTGLRINKYSYSYSFGI
jgi:hypothetical protein